MYRVQSILIDHKLIIYTIYIKIKITSPVLLLSICVKQFLRIIFYFNQ